MNTTHVLYLHGFRSSPKSTKALMMAQRLRREHPKVHWCCPQLPASPRQTMAKLLAGVAAWPREQMVVMGSSLGGFYAARLANELGCKAVLLNPGVRPARDLKDQVGVHKPWHEAQGEFVFREEYLDQLRELEIVALAHPARVLAIIAKGDELLDWQEMTTRYAGARIKLLPESDHGLSDFAEHLDEILAFLFPSQDNRV